ncbi:MAG: monovalent cation/H+ antiporter subunit D family protein [Magnetospiraceae bacterium]
MTPEFAIVAALLLPFLGLLPIWAGSENPNRREAATLVTGALTFIAVISLIPPVMAGERPEVTLLEMMPGLSLTLKVEPLGLLFACIASFLWMVTTIYAIGYMRGHGEQNQTRFYLCFAIAIGSAIGVAFAGNLLTLFVFYETLTISTYPLVTHAQTEDARRGGRTYMGILLGTSIGFQLPALIWIWHLTGTLDFTPGGILKDVGDPRILSALLVLFTFGVGKAALMPFHRWLPAAMVAPTPVSALLHAVAVVKAGVFTVLKVTVYIFGIDVVRTLPASDFLIYVAAATILLGSLVAMRQDNLKRRLAYSTVSQLSYIVMAAMLATHWGVIGGGAHILMHAFGKITLFFCAGAILVAAHKTEVSQLSGIGKRMPWTMTAFLIGALSIIGMPLLGGLWSKWFIALGALEADKIFVVVVLMISSLLNIAYLLPIPIRAFLGKEPEPNHHEDHGENHDDAHGDGHHDSHDHGEAPLPILLAQSFTAAGCVVLFFFPDPVQRLLESVASALP